MSEQERITIADSADMIVGGYAFNRVPEGVRIVNLNQDGHSLIISMDGKVLESSMDPVEEAIASEIWQNDAEFMEVENA